MGETPSWTTSGLGLLSVGFIKSSWAQFKGEQLHDGGADRWIYEHRPADLNMCSSAKQRQEGRLNLYKYLKCVNTKKGDYSFNTIHGGMICSNKIKT